jgi:hypothetical protein
VINRTDQFQCDGGQNVFWLSRNPDGYVSVNAPHFTAGVAAEYTCSGRKLLFTRAPWQGTTVASYSYDETFAWYELNQEEKSAVDWDIEARIRVTWNTGLYEYMRRPSADWTVYVPEQISPNRRADLNLRLSRIGLPILGQVQETTVNDGAIIPDLSGLSIPDLSGLSNAFESLGVSVAAAMEGVSRIPRTFSNTLEDYVVYEPRANANPDGTWQVTTQTTTANTLPNILNVWTCACGQSFTDVNVYNAHQTTHSPLFTCIICGERFYGEMAFSVHQNAMHTPAVTATTRIPGVKYRCSLCEWEALDLDLVQIHIALKHPLNYGCKIIAASDQPKKVTPTTPVKAKKTGQRGDRTGIIADDFNPDNDIEINF